MLLHWRPENLACFKILPPNLLVPSYVKAVTKYVWLPLPNEFGKQYLVRVTKGFGKSYQAIVAL